MHIPSMKGYVDGDSRISNKEETYLDLHSWTSLLRLLL